MLVDFDSINSTMFDNVSKYSWFSFMPFMLLGFTTVVLYMAGIISPWYLVLTFIGWVLIAGLGVAVGYHRVFSHNAYPNLPLWKENILLVLGALSGQGSSLSWVAIHRGFHHRYSDTNKDLHSPVAHGLYAAFFGWTLQITKNNPVLNFKYAGNLLRKKNHLWVHAHNMHILWGVPITIGLIFGWKVTLALCCLPTCLSLLQDNLVNVVGHKKALIGYRNFDTIDNSHNNILFGYLCWGQGWHNNHHHAPGSFDFGSGISGKWWEFDPCNIFKPFLH
jgi:stearoyl-CoA desaturase (delta-9 desaturase)